MAAADDKPSRSGPPAGPKPAQRACPGLSRRALLGAACAVPVLSLAEAPVLAGAASPSLTRHPGLDDRDAPSPGRCIRGPDHGSTFSPALPPPPSAWVPDQVRHDENRTVTKWDRALARFRRAEGALAGLADSEDDGLYDRALGRFNDAMRRLLKTPAPDLAAFVLKLDLAVDQEVATLAGGEACMAALKRDARRLARTWRPDADAAQSKKGKKKSFPTAPRS